MSFVYCEDRRIITKDCRDEEQKWNDEFNLLCTYIYEFLGNSHPSVMDMEKVAKEAGPYDLDIHFVKANYEAAWNKMNAQAASWLDAALAHAQAEQARNDAK